MEKTILEGYKSIYHKRQKKMKYKEQVIEYQKAIEQIKLAYTLRAIVAERERRELSDKLEALERKVYLLTNPPKPAAKELPRGNRKTEIHFYTTYKTDEELMEGIRIGSEVASLGIVDKVNIELPMRIMKNI